MATEDQTAIPDDYDTPEKRVAAWNQYREENEDFIPDWRGAELTGAELPGINLNRAHLENAILTGAHLENANLRGAHLENAKLLGAHLENAGLRGAHLENARLAGARLEKAELNFADLEKANLGGAHLENARLFDAHLEKANLRATHLENVDLRNAVGYRFNGTFIRDCLPSPRAKEPWLRLRMRYTGPKLLFVLFLLSLFLLPYSAKVLWWVGVNKAQALVIPAIDELQETLATQPPQASLSLEQLEMPPDPQPHEAPTLKALSKEALSEYLDGIGWRKWETWQLVLGMDKGWLSWTTALLILAYNGLRIMLTWQVSHLRQDEQFRGPSPDYKPTGSLRGRLDKSSGARKKAAAFLEWASAWLQSIVFLTWCHRCANLLIYVAILSGTSHLLYWLTQPVWLPQ